MTPRFRLPSAPRSMLRPAPAVYLLAALAASALASACSRDGGMPHAEDIPVLMSEAASEASAPRGGSRARRAVRVSFRTMLQLEAGHVAEVAKRFSRPELRSYLMLEESYIGGTFPRGTAVLLREVQRFERDYLAILRDYRSVLSSSLASAELTEAQRTAVEEEIAGAYAEQQRPVIATHEALERWAARTAELYELVAARPGAIRSVREGLEISDAALLGKFNRKVDEVNAAHALLDSAIRALAPEQQVPFTHMGITTRVEPRAGSPPAGAAQR